MTQKSNDMVNRRARLKTFHIYWTDIHEMNIFPYEFNISRGMFDGLQDFQQCGGRGQRQSSRYRLPTEENTDINKYLLTLNYLKL